MTAFFNRQNLLIIAAVLVAIRVVLMPLLNWQNDQIQSLTLKFRQVAKLESLQSQLSQYQEKVELTEVLLDKAAKGFFSDDDKTKLRIQKKIEVLFESNKLSIQDFSWIFDDSSEVRTLRASIRYRGQLADVIKAKLLLAQDSKLIREVYWQQSIKNNTGLSLGNASGTTTLEFYATAIEEKINAKQTAR